MSAAAARLCALLLVLFIGAAHAAPSFPKLTGRVVDEANILSPAAEQSLTARLAQLEAETGRQLVVVTLASLQGYEIEEYGYQLGRAWGIGRAAEDDGVLLIVAPAERRVRIEVGYGLEGVLTDALSSVILQERVLPRFREGDMEGGIVSGADALIEQLALPDDQARARVAAASEQTDEAGVGEGFALIFTVFVMLWVLSILLSGGRRRRRRGLWWIPPVIIGGGGWRGGGGGFSGGGGSFGGGGASGSW